MYSVDIAKDDWDRDKLAPRMGREDTKAEGGHHLIVDHGAASGTFRVLTTYPCAISKRGKEAAQYEAVEIEGGDEGMAEHLRWTPKFGQLVKIVFCS